LQQDLLSLNLASFIPDIELAQHCSVQPTTTATQDALLVLLNPAARHITEDMCEKTGGKGRI
jgi:methyl coenzyme M reductase subunit C